MRQQDPDVSKTAIENSTVSRCCRDLCLSNFDDKYVSELELLDQAPDVANTPEHSALVYTLTDLLTKDRYNINIKTFIRAHTALTSRLSLSSSEERQVFFAHKEQLIGFLRDQRGAEIEDLIDLILRSPHLNSIRSQLSEDPEFQAACIEEVLVAIRSDTISPAYCFDLLEFINRSDLMYQTEYLNCVHDAIVWSLKNEDLTKACSLLSLLPRNPIDLADYHYLARPIVQEVSLQAYDLVLDKVDSNIEPEFIRIAVQHFKIREHCSTLESENLDSVLEQKIRTLLEDSNILQNLKAGAFLSSISPERSEQLVQDIDIRNTVNAIITSHRHKKNASDAFAESYKASLTALKVGSFAKSFGLSSATDLAEDNATFKSTATKWVIGWPSPLNRINWRDQCRWEQHVSLQQELSQPVSSSIQLATLVPHNGSLEDLCASV